MLIPLSLNDFACLSSGTWLPYSEVRIAAIREDVAIEFLNTSVGLPALIIVPSEPLDLYVWTWCSSTMNVSGMIKSRLYTSACSSQ